MRSDFSFKSSYRWDYKNVFVDFVLWKITKGWKFGEKSIIA